MSNEREETVMEPLINAGETRSHAMTAMLCHDLAKEIVLLRQAIFSNGTLPARSGLC
ncbi:hypothetical protein [Serratia ficaria]|uniref:hypothetical protein n=1 Tax=Serratia ficaria TaxID=61651 RepID=UPI000AD2E4E5|nr:hypothetical protein [Serratia ficaria]